MNESESSRIQAIPVPHTAVVVVLSYADAELMYEYIKAHPGLPAVFQTFATVLTKPIE